MTERWNWVLLQVGQKLGRPVTQDENLALLCLASGSAPEKFVGEGVDPVLLAQVKADMVRLQPLLEAVERLPYAIRA